jgi:hypothetical protein
VSANVPSGRHLFLPALREAIRGFENKDIPVVESLFAATAQYLYNRGSHANVSRHVSVPTRVFSIMYVCLS